MRDPFKIDGPTCISFSGGRTSAYMLWRVIQAHGGTLPADVVVCFANTGKEDEATLKFVDKCSYEWGVRIDWVEYRDDDRGFERVTWDSASRHGEPFEALLAKRPMLPNPTVRFCTQELKIRPIARWLMHLGFEGTRTYLENASWVGIRADEQRRAAKIADKSRIPLWAAGVTAADVGSFWREQPFDLDLPNINGKTMHGNCDLCFLKPAALIASLISEKPERAIWWARMEERAEATASTAGAARFRQDRPSYGALLKLSEDQRDLFDPNEEAIACFCGD